MILVTRKRSHPATIAYSNTERRSRLDRHRSIAGPGDLHYPPTARVGRLTRKVAQLEAAFSRYRAIGHAPSLVFEITVSVTRARGSCTERNETPASCPSRRTASFDAWSQKPSP